MGRWDADELAALKRLASDGVSGPEIASRLGRSTGAVQQKALELGIELVRVDRTGWQRETSAPPDRQDDPRSAQERATGEQGRPT